MKKNKMRVFFFSLIVLLIIIILLVSRLNNIDNARTNETNDSSPIEYDESEKVNNFEDIEHEENENTISSKGNEEDSIEFTVLGKNTIFTKKDRISDEFYGIQQLNNRWELDEIDAILNSIKGVWQADEYIGFVDSSIYYADLFYTDDNLEEDIREKLYDEYDKKVENAKINIPELSISVKENEGIEINSNYIYVDGYYPSPISIIFSIDRVNENYPIFVDQTTISKDFYVEYPTLYIKFFVPVEDSENQGTKYNMATLVISNDEKFYLLIDGTFYSLINLSERVENFE